MLDGKGVFADGRPPDIGQGARSLAVDALNLVRPDDDVGEGAAVLNLEDGIRVVTLILAGAGDTAVVHHHAAIEGLAGGDSLDRGQGGGPGGGGERAAGRRS